MHVYHHSFGVSEDTERYWGSRGILIYCNGFLYLGYICLNKFLIFMTTFAPKPAIKRFKFRARIFRNWNSLYLESRAYRKLNF